VKKIVFSFFVFAMSSCAKEAVLMREVMHDVELYENFSDRYDSDDGARILSYEF